MANISKAAKQDRTENSKKKLGAPFKSEKSIQRGIRFPAKIDELIQKEIKSHKKNTGYDTTVSKVVVRCVEKALNKLT